MAGLRYQWMIAGSLLLGPLFPHSASGQLFEPFRWGAGTRATSAPEPAAGGVVFAGGPSHGTLQADSGASSVVVPAAHSGASTVGCTDPCGICPYHGGPYDRCGCGRHGGNARGGCETNCPSPCRTPSQTDTPRGGGEEETPRGGSSVSPGMYVAPTQSGIYEGGRRGLELGGVSVTLPEITLGMPRLRFDGISRSLRGPQMRLDSAVAPYVANPYYAQALAAQQAVQPRGGSGDDGRGGGEENGRGNGNPNRCENGPGGVDDGRGSCSASEVHALHDRVARLERCVEMQCRTLDRCLQHMQGAGRPGCVEPVPVPHVDPNYGSAYPEQLPSQPMGREHSQLPEDAISHPPLSIAPFPNETPGEQRSTDPNIRSRPYAPHPPQPRETGRVEDALGVRYPNRTPAEQPQYGTAAGFSPIRRTPLPGVTNAPYRDAQVNSVQYVEQQPYYPAAYEPQLIPLPPVHE